MAAREDRDAVRGVRRDPHRAENRSQKEEAKRCAQERVTSSGASKCAV